MRKTALFAILLAVETILFCVSPARADGISSICAPSADFFQAHTFSEDLEKIHILPEKGNESFVFSIMPLSAWAKIPVTCNVKTIIKHHVIEIKAVKYYPAGSSPAMCSGGANTTMEVLLDGQIFASADDVYGFCQPMQTFVEFDGVALSFCVVPDLGAVVIGDTIPQWAHSIEGEGAMEIKCKRLNLERQDIRN